MRLFEAADHYLIELRRLEANLSMMDPVDEGRPLISSVRMVDLDRVVDEARWSLFYSAGRRPPGPDVLFRRFLNFSARNLRRR